MTPAVVHSLGSRGNPELASCLLRRCPGLGGGGEGPQVSPGARASGPSFRFLPAHTSSLHPVHVSLRLQLLSSAAKWDQTFGKKVSAKCLSAPEKPACDLSIGPLVQATAGFSLARPCFSWPPPQPGFLGTNRISGVLLLPLPSARPVVVLPVACPCLDQVSQLCHPRIPLPGPLVVVGETGAV